MMADLVLILIVCRSAYFLKAQWFTNFRTRSARFFDNHLRDSISKEVKAMMKAISRSFSINLSILPETDLRCVYLVLRSNLLVLIMTK